MVQLPVLYSTPMPVRCPNVRALYGPVGSGRRPAVPRKRCRYCKQQTQRAGDTGTGKKISTMNKQEYQEYTDSVAEFIAAENLRLWQVWIFKTIW